MGANRHPKTHPGETVARAPESPLGAECFISRSPSQDARLSEGIQPLTLHKSARSSPQPPRRDLADGSKSARIWGCSYQKVLCLSQYAYFSESPAMVISKPKHCFLLRNGFLGFQNPKKFRRRRKGHGTACWDTAKKHDYLTIS